MNKFYLTLLLAFSLAPAAMAQEPDIIYVDGKPVFIKGLEEPVKQEERKTREEMIEAEVARSNVPGDIYRGTVLGSQTPSKRGEVFGAKQATYKGNKLGETPTAMDGSKIQSDLYRGKVFGQEKAVYQGETLGPRELAKTKFVYDTSLVRAIKTQDFDRVRTLIYANVDVNERNYAGLTPLTVAAEKGNMEILRMLVEEGTASVNLPSSYGVTPLLAAAAAGQTDAVNYLLENGADVKAKDDLGKTALIHAMGANDRRLTEKLLELDPRAIDMPDNMGNTPLIYAAQQGSVDNIRILLKHNVNPDYQNPATGLSALSAAAAAGQEKAAQVLVSNGADVNLKDKNGRTALFFASENGQTGLMRQLLRMGADINIVDNNGQNVFIAAAQNQNIPSMQVLTPEYFSIDSADAKSKTALMYTTENGIDALQWMIENGADLNRQDDNGNSALMHAIKNLNEKGALILVKNDVDLTAVNKEGKDAFALAADLMPQSPVMKVLEVKKHTLLQEQLKARAAAQALANEEQERLRAQAQALAQEKLKEVEALEAQLAEEEALVKQLQEEALAKKKEELRAEVEQEMMQHDQELVDLQQQLEQAKAKREAEIEAEVAARLERLDNAATATQEALQPTVLTE